MSHNFDTIPDITNKEVRPAARNRGRLKTMKTTILILLTATMLTGCGWFDRKMSALTGDASKVCIDGVLYLQFTSGTSVAYTPDGKVKTCGK